MVAMDNLKKAMKMATKIGKLLKNSYYRNPINYLGRISYTTEFKDAGCGGW